MSSYFSPLRWAGVISLGRPCAGAVGLSDWRKVWLLLSWIPGEKTDVGAGPSSPSNPCVSLLRPQFPHLEMRSLN